MPVGSPFNQHTGILDSFPVIPRRQRDPVGNRFDFTPGFFIL
jgi:hypothetical protein